MNAHYQLDQDYMKINLGKLKLLLPHTEVQSLESISDLSKNNEDEITVGIIVNKGIKLKVFDLDNELNLVSTLSSTRKTCVCLKKDSIEYGIACDAASKIKSKDINIFELPSCMKTELCPVLGFGVKNNNVYNIVNTLTLNNIFLESAAFNE